MNFLAGNFLLTYVGGVLLLVLVGLQLTHPTKRHRQWLLKSFWLGLGIGPVLVLATHTTSLLDTVTLTNGSWSLLELAVFSGLVWAVAATWLLSLKQLSVVSVAVVINWLKVAGFYLLLGGAIWGGSLTGFSPVLILIGVIGLSCIILAASHPRLLVYSAVSAGLFAIVSLAVSYLATHLSPIVTHTTLPFTGVEVVFPLSVIIGIGVLALAAPIMSQWWFGQPLQARK